MARVSQQKRRLYEMCAMAIVAQRADGEVLADVALALLGKHVVHELLGVLEVRSALDDGYGHAGHKSAFLRENDPDINALSHVIGNRIFPDKADNILALGGSLVDLG